MSEYLQNRADEERLKRVFEGYRNMGIKAGIYLEDNQIRDFYRYRYDPVFQECSDIQLVYIVATPQQREEIDSKREDY